MPPPHAPLDFPLFCLPDWPGQTRVEPDLGRIDLPPVSAIVSHQAADGSLAFGASWLEVTTAHPDRLTAYEQFAEGRPGPDGLTGEALQFARERAFQGLFNLTAPAELVTRDVAPQTLWEFMASWASSTDNWAPQAWVLNGAQVPTSILQWAGAWAGVALGPGAYLLLAVGHNVDPDGLSLSTRDFASSYPSPNRGSAPEAGWPWTTDHDRAGLRRLRGRPMPESPDSGPVSGPLHLSPDEWVDYPVRDDEGLVDDPTFLTEVVGLGEQLVEDIRLWNVGLRNVADRDDEVAHYEAQLRLEDRIVDKLGGRFEFRRITDT